MTTRRASHAGTWYSADGRTLRQELDGWLSKVDHHPVGGVGPEGGATRAIIGPHAGYKYCGACAAHAYRQINPRGVKRVFILGPSHHIRLSGCAVSGCNKYQTPLGDLTIDQGINQVR